MTVIIKDSNMLVAIGNIKVKLPLFITISPGNLKIVAPGKIKRTAPITMKTIPRTIRNLAMLGINRSSTLSLLTRRE